MMSRFLSSSFAALLFTFASACGPTGELVGETEPATQESSIIGGVLDMGDPAVVALAVRAGGYESVCTGTLIAPKTVLTAAHCIYAYGRNVTYYVVLGTNSGAPTRAVQVAQQYKHPSYNTSAYDFGLLQLAQPIVDVLPIPLNEAPMGSGLVGQPIRHAGYGLTIANTNASGVKYEVTYSLRQITPYTIESGANGKQTCQGDSGGPAFMVLPGESREKLVGVVSYGDSNCAVEGYDGRVDVGASWIHQTMGGWEQPTCSTDGACVQGCTPIDQDCACKMDGVCAADCLDAAMDFDCPRDCAANGICATVDCGRPDPDCVAVGGLCDLATQCRDRLCLNDPQNPRLYCASLCATTADCPTNYECLSGACRHTQRPVRADLETCRPQSDFCSSGLCTGPAPGAVTRCVKNCVVTGDCASGSVCESGFDSQRYCRPSNVSWAVPTVAAVPGTLGPAAGCSASGSVGALTGLILALGRRRRQPRSNSNA